MQKNIPSEKNHGVSKGEAKFDVISSLIGPGENSGKLVDTIRLKFVLERITVEIATR